MCGYLARASACCGAPPSMLNVLARLPSTTLARAPVTETRCCCASESQELGAAAGSSPAVGLLARQEAPVVLQRALRHQQRRIVPHRLTEPAG